ncbi:AAA family ATPase, partial [Patescibacteria group bacterium]|nr:AAA family ATPase [Patescibacteria group bacterium]
MFKSISIKNFRGIKELDIKDLKNINVLVGDNATGKTTILDAIYILINPGNPGLPLKTNEWRNLSPLTPSYWKSLFFGFNHKNTIELSARGENSRNVTIKPTVSDSTTFSATEQSNGEAKPSSEIKQTLNGLELSFKIGKGKHQSTVEQTSIDFAKLNPSKDYKATLQGNYFNNKTYAGELDLSNKFDAVNQEVGKEEIISFLKKFKEGIEDVELDSYRKLLVKDSSFGNKRVHLNTYGDGVVRGLHMLLDILFKQDGLTLIDEVENGLHWSKQETIW